MFPPQPRGNGPPGMAMQPPPPLMHCQSDVQAKEKLTKLIYEYLALSGATKTAEAFKEEIMNANPALANFKPAEKGSSFLLDWWTIFWDLYCAAPERRDMGEGAYTQEAKYFHDNVLGPMQPPHMNGHGPFGPMGMGGPPDMMGGHPGAFPGRFPPGRMGAPGGPMAPAPFGMFGDPRMAGRIPPPQAMRMPPGATPFPGAPVPPPGAMRPGNGPPQQPPVGMPMPRYNEYMGGPPQAFPGALPNGAGAGGIPPMSMSSPGMQQQQQQQVPPGAGEPPQQPQQFMGMPGIVASSSAMPFGMSDQPMPTTATPSTPLSASALAQQQGGPSSSEGAAPSSVNNNNTVPMPSSVGAPINGTSGTIDDIKPSPASTPHAASGTPAPGSVQSATAATAGQPSTPGGPPSQPPLSAGAPNDLKEDSEITKIKEGLLDGFKTEESKFFA